MEETATIETGSTVGKSPKATISLADHFINQWNKSFQLKVFRMPHLSARSMHTIAGVILKPVRIFFNGATSDLRNSSLTMQDSGTGKKPTVEFVEDIARNLNINFTRRSNITSAGAVGSIVIEDILDSETGCKVKAPIVVQGDLAKYDLITCSEADSILYSKVDAFGNDLLANICESQDPDNQISKKLANGEVPPYTSNTSLFLTTTIPKTLNPRWLEKGLFQRFGLSIKHIPFSEYQSIRDTLIQNAGNKVDIAPLTRALAKKLIVKPIPETFSFSDVKYELNEKCYEFDGLTENANSCDSLKSFTARRDLQMITYCCHHAWLDERDYLNEKDVEYGFKVSLMSWQDLLGFIGQKRTAGVKPISCSNAILNFLKDGQVKMLREIKEALINYNDANVDNSLRVLIKKGLVDNPERAKYKLKN